MNRSEYHVVEEVLPNYEKFGRQAVFRVPNEFNEKLAQELLDNFIYVFD